MSRICSKVPATAEIADSSGKWYCESPETAPDNSGHRQGASSMIVILTGAGISQESGLPTFRGADGMWENERVEDVATPRAFARNPDRVLRFYNQRRHDLMSPKIKPNAAHLALARLEAECAKPFLLVTQNVDDLHERAGSRNLLHMHGELSKARCTGCGRHFAWETDLSRDLSCPRCKRKGALRPHVVWFEETPLFLDEIDAALARCSRFISIGTSGNVYPAAGFASQARSNGAHVMELNLEPSLGASAFHEGRYGRATAIVPQWVDGILS